MDDRLPEGAASAALLVLTEPGQSLDARQAAAVALAEAGDGRAFETLVLLLNHRDPARCEAAARALARLGDPRTGRAAAALATNPLRVAYAAEPVRLLVRMRAPEAAPALSATLGRLVAAPEQALLYWRVALACVEGLGALADPAAEAVLRAAVAVPRLRAAAEAALARVGR